jgi:hypothetical protein
MCSFSPAVWENADFTGLKSDEAHARDGSDHTCESLSTFKKPPGYSEKTQPLTTPLPPPGYTKVGSFLKKEPSNTFKKLPSPLATRPLQADAHPWVLRAKAGGA